MVVHTSITVLRGALLYFCTGEARASNQSNNNDCAHLPIIIVHIIRIFTSSSTIVIMMSWLENKIHQEKPHTSSVQGTTL